MSDEIKNPFPSINPNDLLPFGVIRRTHGRQGDLTIALSREDLFHVDPQFLFLLIDEIPVPYEVIDIRGNKEQLIFSFEDIDDMDKAANFIGTKVLIHKDEIPNGLEKFSSQPEIVGYLVVHETTGTVGTIEHLDNSTANFLLIIKKSDDGNEVMIPLVEEWITSIDSQNKILTLNFPEELLEL